MDSTQHSLRLKGGENWAVWRFQTEVLMKSKGFYEIIMGVRAKPEDANALKEWTSHDAKAQEIIVMRMEPGPLTHVLTCPTASSMWSKLKSVYDKESVVSVHLLQQKFFMLQFEDSSMSVFLSKLEDLVSKLKQAGEPVSEKMTITKILMSLPEQYKHFRSAWESVPSESQNLEGLTSRLLLEEERLGSENKEIVALASIKKCYSCGKEGHIAKVCRNKSTQKETRTCNYCKRRGHIMENCYKLKNRKGKNTNKDSNSEINAFMCSSTSSVERGIWYMDTGASEHMCCDKNLFESLGDKSYSSRVKVGNGTLLEVKGVGNVVVYAWNNCKYIKTILSNVLYIPDLKFNLFSAGYVLDKGMRLVSNSNVCEFINKHGEVRATANRSCKLYKMNFVYNNPKHDNAPFTTKIHELERNFNAFETSCCHITKKVENISVWHNRLSHQNLTQIKDILTRNNISYADKSDDTMCENCLRGKQHRQHYPRSESRAVEKLDLIHADVCGPMENASIGESRYFLLFKDDCTGYRFVYLMKRKSEVSVHVRNFVAQVERECERKVKVLRTDNGLEFMSNELKVFLQEKGIIHQRSVVYTPQQNGRAEREMRTLVEAARAMIYGMSKVFWAEAVNTACYTLNRTGPSPVKGKSPYELFYNKDNISLDFFHEFGCKVSVHIPKEKRLKWDNKSVEGMFVGYGENVKGYRIYFSDKHKVEVHKDVVFLPNLSKNDYVENENLNVCIQNGENVELSDEENIQGKEQEVDKNESEHVINEVQSSDDLCHNETNGGMQLRDRSKIKIPHNLVDYDLGLLTVSDEDPVTYEEAVSSSDSNKWKQAMEVEMKALTENDTWISVDKPKNCDIIDCKWVFKRKKDEKGNIVSHKARLVARGFKQDLSLSEIYSPVARLTSVRLFLAFCNEYNLPIHQLDVCSAFLYGDIDGDVYVSLPNGCFSEKKNNNVYKLKRSLYGLKDSPKNWNKKFHEVITKLGFLRCDYEYCLYMKINAECKVYLLLYIDDLLLASSVVKEIENVKQLLNENFKMKDLGQISHYLGMHVTQNLREGTIIINQSTYLEKLLNSSNMLDCKAAVTPMEENFDHSMLKRDKSESPEIEHRCRKVIGSLMYAMLCSRPDLCLSISILSRYQSCASNDLWVALKRVLRYVKGSLQLSLVFKRGKIKDIIGFVDSDWAGDKVDRRSTGGYVFQIYGCTISWVSRKQTTVALSSTESEYVALSLAVSEACWLKNFFEYLEGKTCSVKLFEDNQSVIKLCKNPQFHHKIKHIDIKINFVRDMVNNNIVSVDYISTDDQVADVLTKPLGKVKFDKFKCCMGLC